MKQFDVFENPDRANRRRVPYVVVILHDRFESLPHVLVAPLIDRTVGDPRTELFPLVTVNGRTLILDVSDMAAIGRRYLVTAIGSIAADHEKVVRAIDILVTGH